MGLASWFSNAGGSQTPMQQAIKDYYASLSDKGAVSTYMDQYGSQFGPGSTSLSTKPPPSAPRTDVTYQENSAAANASLYGTFSSEGGFITPDSVFRASDEVAVESLFETSWNELLVNSGISELSATYGLAQNWWPGLDVEYEGFIDPAGAYGPGGNQMGVRTNDIAAWEVGVMQRFSDPDSGASESIWTRYDATRSSQMFAAMSTTNRGSYNDKLVAAGLLDKGYAGLNDFTAEGASAFTEATRWANYYGVSVDDFLTNQADLFKRKGGGGGGGGGGAARRYTIEVPDYDTLLSQSESMLQQQLGRDPKDWEMSLIADEFQKQYGKWAGAQKRKALGGNGVYEVPDPVALTTEYMEDKYADEISRVEDVKDRSSNNQLILQAATTGARMMGAPTARELPQP